MKCYCYLLLTLILIEDHISTQEDVGSLSEDSEAFLLKWSCLTEDEIDCSSKDISKLDTPLLFSSGNVINFAYNKIEELSVQLYGQNIIKVDLSMNKLRSILGTPFRNLTNVEEVDLSHNALWVLGEDTFAGLTNLKSLDLSSNEMRVLEFNSFLRLAKLKKLSLRKNAFMTFEEEAFEHLAELEELDLSENQLSKLPGDLFKYNKQLRVLKLAGNQFKAVPLGPLRTIPNLYLLDLSDNKFQRLRYPDFDKLDKVQVLHLDDHNDLKSIGPQAFQGMNSLTYFSANNNKNLRFVDPKAFYDNETDAPIQITSFIFRHNSVTTLSGQLLNWVGVKADLRGNPWNCDCTLDWMANLVDKDQEQGLTCAHPNYLRGRLINNMTSEEFKCSFLFNHEFTIIGTILLIITISMIMVVFLYIIVKLLSCPRIRNPFRRNYGYSKVKVSKNGKNYDLEWDPAIGDPNN